MSNPYKHVLKTGLTHILTRKNMFCCTKCFHEIKNMKILYKAFDAGSEATDFSTKQIGKWLIINIIEMIKF